MKYSQAKAVGDAGERRVADVLMRYRGEHQPVGYLPNVLLEVGKMTAQLDHVVIDRHGILMIEVKVRNAFLRGTADQPRWTAVYGASNKSFQNPLEQLTRQRNTLREALRSVSDPIDADLVQSVVVFVGADVHALDLDSASRRRVTTLEHLPALLRERAAVTEGLTLTDERVSRRYEQLHALDRSADPEVQARHAAYRGGASVPAVVEPQSQPVAQTAPLVGVPTASPAPPPKVTLSGNPYRPQARPATSRPVVWANRTAMPARPPSRARTSKRASKREQAAVELIVTLIVMMAVMGWLSSGGLASCMSGYVHSVTSQSVPVSK
jgi:hypothetical protein